MIVAKATRQGTRFKAYLNRHGKRFYVGTYDSEGAATEAVRDAQRVWEEASASAERRLREATADARRSAIVNAAEAAAAGAQDKPTAPEIATPPPSLAPLDPLDVPRTLPELARALRDIGIEDSPSVAMLYRWTRLGTIPYSRLGGRVRSTVRVVLDLMRPRP